MNNRKIVLTFSSITTPGKIHGVALFAILTLSVSSCGDTGNVTIIDPLPGQGQHTEHTDVEQGIWPPQPLNMTDVVILPATSRETASTGILNTARSLVVNDPTVIESLGDKYIELDGMVGDSKGDLTATYLFYSYSFNNTLEVDLLRSGELRYEHYAATVYQPTEHVSEIKRAIDLAESALTANGFETAGLKGTAMLAFPRASTLTDAGQQFYSSRVLYVTFGPGDGELPVYSALANLSTGTVSEEGLIR